MTDKNYYFYCCQKDTDALELWQLSPSETSPKRIHAKTMDAGFSGMQCAQVGNYLLLWGGLTKHSKNPSYPYALFELAEKPEEGLGQLVTKGIWSLGKFGASRPDFANPNGDPILNPAEFPLLVPMGSFVLNWQPQPGRCEQVLYVFDPEFAQDPIAHYAQPKEPWGDIQLGHDLIPVQASYLIDYERDTGTCRLFNFDPMNPDGISYPPVARGIWGDIGPNCQLTGLGDAVLVVQRDNKTFSLWAFDAHAATPLTHCLTKGALPADWGDMRSVAAAKYKTSQAGQGALPGTMDFMRDKIKHVVYFMVENRSLDHILGWLYERDQPQVLIGSDKPYDGANTDLFNINNLGEKVHLSKYAGGTLSPQIDLDFPAFDPYHEHTDVMRQMFYKGYSKGGHGDPDGEPNMGGFCWNNDSDEVMETFTAEQVPVLNGLAKSFAVSDRWFSSMPGGTDVNRAFSLSGSSYKLLNNFQNGNLYSEWPEFTHRPSVWRTLWTHGERDWKIYNRTTWINQVFTYELFLEGQIPYVDQNKGNFLNSYDQFLKDAREGTLPKFSYVEPIWVSLKGSSSYHPCGDLIPGERQLNEMYEALRDGGLWDSTLLIITFDEHGGLFDHVPPTRSINPYPNDETDGFRFDRLGVRVPTILVSPWIAEKTVFRSTSELDLDATSFLASLMKWYGIPETEWQLGDRTQRAPTFETVLSLAEARTDKPSFQPPYDRTYPPQGAGDTSSSAGPAEHPVHGLHKQIARHMIRRAAGGAMSSQELAIATRNILESCQTQQALVAAIQELQQKASAGSLTENVAENV